MKRHFPRVDLRFILETREHMTRLHLIAVTESITEVTYGGTQYMLVPTQCG